MKSRLFALAGLVAAGVVSASDWPQWRGPDRTGLSAETGLLRTWPAAGPPKVWSVDGLGGGYGPPVVAGGKIYGTGKVGGDGGKGKKAAGGKEIVWCRNEKDGSPVWAKEFADSVGVGYGEGPRSAPTYHKLPNGTAVVYAVGVGGTLACLKADTGDPVWSKNYGKDFGGKMMSGWGFSESVLVDGDKLICTPGGDAAAVVALNPATGATVWKAAVPGAGGAGYASPVKHEFGGVPMYITLLGKSGGVVAVHAKTGKLLWQYKAISNGTANIPTVIAKGDLVWCSTGYNDGGSALLKLASGGKDAVTATEVVKYGSREIQNHHGGMVLVGDHVYFGSNHNKGFPACVEFKTGKIAWKEEKGAGGGDGSAAVVYADGMLYYRYQNAQMVLTQATPEGLKVAGSFKLPDPSGKPSWAHPVIANGRLLIRDQEKMHAFDLRASTN